MNMEWNDGDDVMVVVGGDRMDGHEGGYGRGIEKGGGYGGRKE